MTDERFATLATQYGRLDALYHDELIALNRRLSTLAKTGRYDTVEYRAHAGYRDRILDELWATHPLNPLNEGAAR